MTYDPAPDLADLLRTCYHQVVRERYSAVRDPLRRLVNGLGVADPDSYAAWLAALPARAADPRVFVVPSGLSADDAKKVLDDAAPGDIIHEVSTPGREWVKLATGAWVNRARAGTNTDPRALT